MLFSKLCIDLEIICYLGLLPESLSSASVLLRSEQDLDILVIITQYLIT